MRPHLAVLWLAIAMIGYGAPGAAADPLVLEGEARVLDGRTIEIWGQEIRLWGIIVPDGETEEGQQAALQLQRLLANVVVRCESKEMVSLRHVVARCYVGKIDIAWPMVLTGSALDDPEQSGGHYAQSQ